MTPRELLEAFETLADAPDGVRRLREWVLQLAVRGKLVPQDPGDEPANRLCERLVDARYIGRRKTSVPLGAHEQRFEVPPGWMWGRIGDLFDVAGGIQKSGKRTPNLNPVPYLRVANVQRGRLDLSDVLFFEVFDGEVERWRLRAGDLLIVEGNGSENEIGRCARWAGAINPCIHQNHLIRARPLVDDLELFVIKYLNSPDGVSVMKSLAVTTSGLYNLSVGKILSIAIPVPPVAEQLRIVARVDELMGLLDRLEAARAVRDEVRRAARDSAFAALRDAEEREAFELAWTRISSQMDSMFTTPEDVAPLRQAILQLAVRGILSTRCKTDTPVRTQLSAVAADRQRLVLEKQLRPQEIAPPVTREMEPFALPEGWAWLYPDDITACVRHALAIGPFGSSLLKSDYRKIGIPLVFVRDITSRRFGGPGTHYIETAKAVELSAHTVKSGDLLITKMGAPPGDTAVYPPDRPAAIITADCIKFTVHPALGFVDFFQYTYRSPAIHTAILDITMGIAHQKMSLKRFRFTPIPVPPLAEQRRIVAKVDTLMAFCDELEARLTAARDLQAQFAAAVVHHLDV